MSGAESPEALRAASIEFVLEIARTLHALGASAPEVEHAMATSSRQLGLRGEFFATPTSIFATFHAPGGRAHGATTHLMRVEPRGAHLGRRARTDEVLADVLAGRLGPDEGRQRLRGVLAEPEVYPRVLVLASSALISAGAARLFGLAPGEIALAGVIGLLIEVLDLLAGTGTRLRRVFLPLSAFLAAGLVALDAGLRGAPTPFQVIVAGLIALLPGLRMTTAMSELALDHLAAGTARLMGAVMTLIALLFGAALGAQLGELFPDELPMSVVETARTAVPAWTLYLALLVLPICFGVVFRALPRDLPWILLSCTLALVGSHFGATVLGRGFEAALGGLLVGLASNVYARALDRPAATTLLPGVLLLVPGTIGFRSLFDLVERDVVTGIDTAFQTATVGISIVAGLFVANVIVRPRKLDEI